MQSEQLDGSGSEVVTSTATHRVGGIHSQLLVGKVLGLRALLPCSVMLALGCGTQKRHKGVEQLLQTEPAQLGHLSSTEREGPMLSKRSYQEVAYTRPPWLVRGQKVWIRNANQCVPAQLRGDLLLEVETCSQRGEGYSVRCTRRLNIGTSGEGDGKIQERALHCVANSHDGAKVREPILVETVSLEDAPSYQLVAGSHGELRISNAHQLKATPVSPTIESILCSASSLQKLHARLSSSALDMRSRGRLLLEHFGLRGPGDTRQYCPKAKGWKLAKTPSDGASTAVPPVISLPGVADCSQACAHEPRMAELKAINEMLRGRLFIAAPSRFGSGVFQSHEECQRSGLPPLFVDTCEIANNTIRVGPGFGVGMEPPQDNGGSLWGMSSRLIRALRAPSPKAWRRRQIYGFRQLANRWWQPTGR